MLSRTVAISLLVTGIAAAPALATTIYSVTIETATVAVDPGFLALDITSSDPRLNGNTVTVEAFSTSGILTTSQVQGGPVLGDLLFGLNPAPVTTIYTQFGFNELLISYAMFGSGTSFVLDLDELPPQPGSPPDEFALFLLDASGSSLFPTADPLGADSLFTIDITGDSGGALQVFDPSTLDVPTNSIDVIVPGTSVATPELPTALLTGSLVILAALRQWREAARLKTTRMLAHGSRPIHAVVA